MEFSHHLFYFSQKVNLNFSVHDFNVCVTKVTSLVTSWRLVTKAQTFLKLEIYLLTTVMPKCSIFREKMGQKEPTQQKITKKLTQHLKIPSGH